MPKDGFMTPKAIANRIKAKGLQKLRWYCQMCQKQCRDENGFKCHTMSDSHMRQMQLFGSRPGSFLAAFNHEFEKGFMDILKRRFGEKRVFANLVYNEYISDKNHAHMNATSWTSLSGFVRYLGKTGKAIIEETPKGWYIQYIDKDPEKLARQEALAKKEKMDVDDDDRVQKIIEKRIEETQKMLPASEQQVPSEESPINQTPLEPVKFALGFKKEVIIPATDDQTPQPENEPQLVQKPSSPVDVVQKDTAKANFRDKQEASSPIPQSTVDKKRKLTAVEELMLEQEKAKMKHSRQDYWIVPGIVVKVLNKNLAGGKYYKQKGVIESCPSTYVAQIKMLDFGDVLKLDQSQLETVIPKMVLF
jgi:DNA/RNA-binding protein KIN17